MNTFIFLIVVIIYLLLSLFVTEGDLFFPSNIVMLMYLLSLFFLVGEMNKWSGNISSKSLILLLLGLTVYLVFSLTTLKIFSRVSLLKKKQNSTRVKLTAKQALPVIADGITVLIIIYEIFAIVKYYIDIKNISSSIRTYSSFGEMIGNYRNAAAYGNLNISISTFSAYNYQIMLALAYIYAGIVIQYIVSKQKTSLKWKILHYSPIIIYGACTILTGGRNPLINLGLAIIVMYFIKLKQIKGKNPLRFKTICKLVLGGSVALISFSSFRGLVGRTSDYTTFDYLAMYIGAPIKLFDLFINSAQQITHRFIGQETFTSFLGDIGKDVGSSNLEFRSSNGFGLGNVYTPFRRYYSDFGIWGLIILTAIQSFFYSFYYSKLVNNKVKGIDICTILYSYLFVGVVYYSVDERLYTYFLSWYTIKGIIFMIIFSVILPKIKLNSRKIN